MILFSPGFLVVLVLLLYHPYLCHGKTEGQDIFRGPVSILDSAPEKCRAVFLQDGSLSVSWCRNEKQREDTDSGFDYQVIVNSESSVQRTAQIWTRRCEETIRDLRTGGKHIVRVSLDSKMKYECTALKPLLSNEKPGPPQSFQVFPQSATVIEVSWTQPNDSRKPVDFYRLFWISPSGLVSKHTPEGDEASFRAERLAPFACYHFFLAACFEEGNDAWCGENKTASSTTLMEAPGQPKGLDSEWTTSMPLKISWKFPDKTESPIDGYRVNVSEIGSIKPPETNTTSELSLEVKGVEACKEYYISVEAFINPKGDCPNLFGPEANITRTNPCAGKKDTTDEGPNTVGIVLGVIFGVLGLAAAVVAIVFRETLSRLCKKSKSPKEKEMSPSPNEADEEEQRSPLQTIS